MNTIFVQIASYRDPQLVKTIESLLENAKNPEKLMFSICWQHSNDDVWDNLNKYKNDSRFKIIEITATDSKGACWARNLLQQHYNNEDWTLQLDSHHRFEKGWDETLIQMWYDLHNNGVSKPLITTYLPSFDPDSDPSSRVKTPYKMDNPHFTSDGIVLFKSSYVSNWKTLNKPQPTYFYSAHFAFAKGDFVKEVPHDPHLYFHGEEISIAARAYTWGYDMYYPHIIIAYHEYTRKYRTKIWDDDKDWWKLDKASKLRFNYLFNQIEKPHEVEFGTYGFGSVRPLYDYEAACGINFKDKTIN